MNTENVAEANQLTYEAQRLAALKSALNADYIEIGFFTLTGKRINSSMIKLDKNTAVASPDPFQTLGAAFVSDAQSALDTAIVDIQTEIGGLSC